MRNSRNVDPSLGSEEEEYVSAKFKMPAKSLFGTMLMLYGRWWLPVCAVPLIAGIVVWSITGDLRWLIVSMMFLFIVLPMIAALLYFNYGLQRECFLNAVLHDVAIASDGLVITLYRRVLEENDVDDAEDTEEKWEKGYTFEIPYSQLRPFHIVGSAVVIPAGKGFIWLPLKAFPSSDAMSRFMQRISQGIASRRYA